MKHIRTLALLSLSVIELASCKQATQDKERTKFSGVENLAQPIGDNKPVNPICGAATPSTNESLVAWMKGGEPGAPHFVNGVDGSAMTFDDPRMVAFAMTASSLHESVIKFLLATKTKVEFTKGEPDACKSTPDDALFSKFQKESVPKYSCFQKVEGEPSPVIYFGEMSKEAFVKAKEFYGANDADWANDLFIIRRDLVRNAGGIYARMIRLIAKAAKEKSSDSQLSEAQKKAILAVSAEYEAAMKNRGPLTDAFMCDMHIMEGDQCKDGVNFPEEAKQRVKDIKKIQGDELFGDYLVTEAFDSYHCNDQTKKSFQDSFSSTFSAFESFFVQVDFSAPRN